MLFEKKLRNSEPRGLILGDEFLDTIADAKKKTDIEKAALEGLIWPAKFRILPGFVFRQTKPAVFGVEVLAGRVRPKVSLLTTDGREIGEIKGIENSFIP
jgi:translation initiation factor 5B